MSVIGHGIDLVVVAELQRWIEDPRNPLLPRCFTEGELEEIGDGPNRNDRLAGRFAAKLSEQRGPPLGGEIRLKA